MPQDAADLSPHCRNILHVLHKSGKAMSAYALLGALQKSGIKAPTTVYRALDTLMQNGLVHRIETINAFIACCHHATAHGAQFAVCRACGDVTELQDNRLTDAMRAAGQRLKFRIEREMLEILGLCQRCDKKAES